MDELLAPIGQLGAAMAALEVTDAAAEKALQEVLAGTDTTDDEAAQRRGRVAHVRRIAHRRRAVLARAPLRFGGEVGTLVALPRRMSVHQNCP